MTKKEWAIHWRQFRSNRPKVFNTTGQLTAALRELYDYSFTPKQSAFIRLVNRYKKKLGPEYFEQIERWKPDAKARASEIFKTLVYSKNPFLGMLIKKDNVSVKDEKE